ncbi:MAG: L,D-transpeptidase family protein [Gammaproteobacteria bacterium]|nr:L,D-transpeptidase family protein [Gammaproteobacteria bacterium]
MKLCRSLLVVFAASLFGGCAVVDGLLPQASPQYQVVDSAQPANRYSYNDDDVVGDVRVVIATHEDTLPALARRYDVGYDEIVGANPGVDVWLPGAGTEIVLPTRFILPPGPREGIVINVAARRLFYYPVSEPGVVLTFPVGIGRDDWATPLGAATVVDKLVEPAWYPPASIRAEHAAKGDPLPAIVPPGPDNPLGRHALLLSMDGYLLHGTNKPAGVGMQVSHGCIRLYPEDIEGIFADLPLGTPVRIVDEPVLAGWRGEQLYMQRYAAIEADSLVEVPAQSGVAVRPKHLRRLDEVRRGIAVAVGRGAPRPDPLLQLVSVN